MSDTKTLLDKYYKVTKHIDNPKFYPYFDEYGGKDIQVSPFTDFMYYSKLPEIYRKFDEPLGKPLYRFLQSLLEGGYAELAYNTVKGERGIEQLLDLINPETCPAEFLPLYCKSMGIDWFQDLVIKEKPDPYVYLRTFLCNVGEIYKRRGTESVVKYVAKVLTSMDVKLRYKRLYQGTKTKARILWVELQAHTDEEINSVGLNSEIIKRFIDTQIPYYITSSVLYILRKDLILNDNLIGCFSTKRVRQRIMMTVPKVTLIADSEDNILSDSEHYLIAEEES